MLQWVYQTLRCWAGWLSPKIIRSFRAFGNQLAGLGTEDLINSFYKALDSGSIAEAQYYFDKMVLAVGQHPDQLEYADYQLLRAYTFLHDEIQIQAAERERQKSYSEVTKHLNHLITAACGEEPILEPDPDEEPTELTDSQILQQAIKAG